MSIVNPLVPLNSIASLRSGLIAMDAPLRIGLIGAGRIAARHLPAFHGDSPLRLVAVCDVDESAAGRLAAPVGASTYTDPFQLIREAPIDAVDICTPHDSHAALAIAAAQSGKHVLVQKPLGFSMEQCQAVVNAARSAGITLMAAMSHRFSHRHRELRHRIESGEAGRITAFRLSSFLNVPAFAPPGHWIYDPARAGGGVIMSLMLQQVDLLRYLVGDVRAVLRATSASVHPAFGGVLEDHASATLQLEDDAVAELAACFSAKSPRDDRLEVIGERGTLQLGARRWRNARPVHH